MRPILILGAYGNFGKRIAHALSRAEYPVVVAGRNARKAATVMAQLPGAGHEIAVFDVNLELDRKLRELDPCVVVNTCGPFQNADYRIAETCINRQVPYIDLADGRKFVAGIAALDSAAVESNTTVISGASTVPGLSSAVVEEYAGEFSELRTMVYGISPGQKAERGLATTQAIMSYVGKPLAPIGPDNSVVYGWQDIYRQTYPELGKRWMANCDIPDLDLFPERYGIAQINFSAGVELAPLHFGLWGLSWLVRWGLPLDLPRWSRALLAASNLFDGFGSADGVMHIILAGLDRAGRPYKRSWFMVAKNGDGPQIPTVPTIVLAKKIASGETVATGAMACVGLLSVSECLAELEDFDVEIATSGALLE